MPIRRSAPVKITPRGLTDSRDGTNSFPGAMKQLVNLIPDPTTAGEFVCRPAAELMTVFAGANAPTAPGIVSALLTVGDHIYGMISSSRNAGKDEPFHFHTTTGMFLLVAGITNANTPTTPPSSGDWTPPIMAQVAGRVLVTHPGFPGGTVKFGWFDVSGFSETTIGNENSNTTIDGNPAILGVQPGMTVTGPNIPAGTTVVATAAFVLTTSGLLTTNTLSQLGTTIGIRIGQTVAGFGIPDGTTVLSIPLTTGVYTGSTHTSTLIDNLVFVSGAGTLPTIGVRISGTGIQANTEVSSVMPVSFSMTATLNGTTTIHVASSAGILANQSVTGSGIPAATLVVSSTPFTLTTTGTIANGSAVITSLASTTGVVAGQTITGFGIPATGVGGVAITVIVVSVDSPTQVTISQPCNQSSLASAVTFSGSAVVLNNAATITANFVQITFTSLAVTLTKPTTATADGVTINFDIVTIVLTSVATVPGGLPAQVTFAGGSITLSQAATGSGPSISLTIAGGTVTAPLWGAGDCDRNPLLSTPLAVAQFNGRAYFAVGIDGIVFSDSGLPCRVSNQPNVQALTPSDGTAVTMVAPLELSSPITGGIVQALIAFEGDGSMRQITGDPATNNLSMNLLPIATGTLAPLSVIPCSLGTAFVSPQGLRFIRPDGSVTDPVGIDGKGVINPFLFAISPSRICAEANVAVLRITVQNGAKPGNPFEEYWFDLSRQTFTGPHSFPARMVQHWRSTFIMAPVGIPAALFSSSAYQTSSSVFVEAGIPLSWIEETVLLPDNSHMAMNAMVEANTMLAAAPGDTIAVDAFDESGLMLDAVLLAPPTADLRQRKLNWTQPVIFKQMSKRSSGMSNASVRLGNDYMRYEILGYNNDDASDSNFLLGNDGVILDSNASVDLAPG